MPLGQTHRYTPASCTLEVIHRQAVLAPWRSSYLVRFALRFERLGVALQGSPAQLRRLHRVLRDHLGRLMDLGIFPCLPPEEPSPESRELRIEASNLWEHLLFLGPLGTLETGPVLRLNILDLADLTAALDQYEQDRLARPRSTPWAMPTWARTALPLVVVTALATSLVNRLTTVAPVTKTVVVSPAPLPPAPLPRIAQTTPLPASKAPLHPAVSPNPKPLATPQVLPPPPTSLGPPVVIPNPSGILQPPPVALSPGPALPPPPPVVANVHPLESKPPIVTFNQTNSPPPALTPSSTPSKSTIFDTIPQVAQVRSYFQQHWTPPAHLSDALQYILVLSPNGTIRQITPLGTMAGNYIDQTGMPLIGEPFVSPVAGNYQPQIRVVLNPDGTVQTFLQSSN